MIQDSDTQAVNSTIDDAFLNEDILIAMGFKYKGTYNDYTYNTHTAHRTFTYVKEDLGHFDVQIQQISSYGVTNNTVPETDIVVVSSVTHPVNHDPIVNEKIEKCYLLRVRDLKKLIEFRRLTTKIAALQYQAEDMLRNGSICTTLRELEIDVSGF